MSIDVMRSERHWARLLDEQRSRSLAVDMILIAGEGLDALGGAYVLRLSELEREPDDLALAG